MGGQMIQWVKKAADLSPRSKTDYYKAGRWLVSRRLLYWLALAVCLASLICICLSVPAGVWKRTGGYPVYSWRSLRLKLYSGKAAITGKSGYTAYTGQVEQGAAQGKGTLYRKDGTIVYQGQFEKNQFQGEGTLYRRNGIKSYKGSFEAGRKQGQGCLYNENGKLIYEGSFQKDEIVFEELAGKKTEEAAEIYQGDMVLYNTADVMCACMKEISAAYRAESTGDTMEGGWEISGIYVMKREFPTVGDAVSGKDLEEWFGKPEYSGTTRIEMAEAVVIRYLEQGEDIFDELPRLDTEQELADVVQVTDYDAAYEVYVRTYLYEGMRYSFFSRDKDSESAFYLIEAGE